MLEDYKIDMTEDISIDEPESTRRLSEPSKTNSPRITQKVPKKEVKVEVSIPEYTSPKLSGRDSLPAVAESPYQERLDETIFKDDDKE